MTEQILAVQRMQEYIETHMDEAITTADLARVSRFSPWHSYRLFHQHTGLTPADYIRRLRLSQSALRLKRENCRVIDVAYDLGFGSVDGYQRAFLREFGCNPGAYARQPVPIPLFIPYGVKFRALRKESIDMEPIQSVFLQIIHKPERKVIIKRGVQAEDYFPYCEEVGCDVWGLLMRAEHPLARGEGLAVAAGDGEITENVAHGGLRERAGLARVVVKAQVGLDRVGEGVHARLRGDGGRERERERGVEDGIAGDQAEVADGVFTVLLSGDDGGDGGL